MSRQLQVRASDAVSALKPTRSSTPANLTRLAVALAPDILQLAERAATRRRAQSQQAVETPPSPQTGQSAQEAVRISEIEVDFSLPFVRRVTRREAVAWRETPVDTTTEEPKKSGRLKKAGLLGASGAVAVAAGLLARRIGPRLSDRDKVIDAEGWRR